MATIRVKFRPSSVSGKPGTIYYQICHGGRHRLIATKIHIMPEQWDDRLGRGSCDDSPSCQMFRLKIRSDLGILYRVVRELEAQGRAYTLEEVVRRFTTSSSRVLVLDYMQQQILHLLRRKKFGTAANYTCAMRSLSSFLEGRDIPFAMFDEMLVVRYCEWLADREIVKNSISFYMRIWRAVYNRAVREKIMEQGYPFRHVYTGVDRTRKRAADEETVFRLLQLDLSHSAALALSRDLFVFSYYTRGMAFVDLAYLRKKDISNNMITYLRRKTAQPLQIRVEPCMARIIARYEPLTRKSAYVFPILHACDDAEAYHQYQVALSYHNRKLKVLGQLAGICLPLSTYTARHTWATMARNRNVPISVISAGMGHTSETTTRIYLASLENSVIDDANRSLLERFNDLCGL